MTFLLKWLLETNLYFFHLPLSNFPRSFPLPQIKLSSVHRESAELLVDDEIPALNVTESCRVRIEGAAESDPPPRITAVLAVGEEIFVASKDGRIRSLTWSGQITAVIDLQNLSFSSSFLQHHHGHSHHHNPKTSGASFYTPGLEVNVVEADDHVTDMVVCSLLDGLALTLASGHALLMRTPNFRLDEMVCMLLHFGGLNTTILQTSNRTRLQDLF